MRFCLGQQLAETNYFIILVSILQKFSILPMDAMHWEDVKELGFVNMVPEEAPIRLKER